MHKTVKKFEFRVCRKSTSCNIVDTTPTTLMNTMLFTEQNTLSIIYLVK